MRATHLIYVAAGRPPIPSKYEQRAGRCAVCGRGGRWDLSDTLGDSFTNWASCSDPSSQVVCSACLFCLKEPALKLGGFVAVGGATPRLTIYETVAQSVARLKSPQGRASAILKVEFGAEAAEKCGCAPSDRADDPSLTRALPRATFWDALRDPPEPPFALAINVAGGMPLPRHMPVACRVAASRESFPVTYCLDTLDWRPATWVPAWEAGARALAGGLWFREVATGAYRNSSLTGLRSLARETEDALAPLRSRAPFALLLDMLPRPKRDTADSPNE